LAMPVGIYGYYPNVLGKNAFIFITMALSMVYSKLPKN
jgi:hypothetical protein